jgi:multicomponent Na+:H+ antiporter subunit F
MTDFLIGTAIFVLATTAVGLVRFLYGPTDADRMMVAQLLGTGSIAALLLVSTVTGLSAAAELAMVIALVAAFGSAAFAMGACDTESGEDA